jgi:uncharacterized membrane protein HdeD (DUF308 family)
MDSIASFALVIAIWAVISGIVQIVRGFELRRVYGQWWFMLVSGLVSAAFGVAALYYYPGLSLTFAVVWAAWWLLLTGGLAMYAAFDERSAGISWGWTLTFGLVSILTGIFAFMSPPTTLAAIMGLIAGFAFVSGAVLLMGAFKLTSAKDRVTDTFRSTKTA